MRMRHFAHSKKSVYFIMTQNSNTVAMKCQKSAFIWCISPQSCPKRTVRQTIRFFYLVRGKSPPALLFAPKSRCASWGKYAATPSLRVPIGKGKSRESETRKHHMLTQKSDNSPERAMASKRFSERNKNEAKKRARCALFRNFKAGLAYWRGFKIS